MLTFEQVVTEVEVERTELDIWIEQSWVLPVQDDGKYIFDDADVARIRLIAELRRDLGINDEAVPIVLRLLDQVYALRKTLGDLNDAIQALPKEFREQLKAELGKTAPKTEPE